MDIAALSVIMHQSQLKQDVSISLMKKAMDTAKQNGSLVHQILDKVNDGNTAAWGNLPHLGNHVDRFV